MNLERIEFSLKSLLCEKDLGLWEILKGLDFPIEAILKIINEKIATKELVIKNGNISLNDTKFKNKYWKKLNREFKKEFLEYKEIIKKRPSPIPDFFQGPILPKDVFKRLKFMHKMNDIVDKKIIILGDDDLMSLAIGLTNLAKDVVVLEIDKRLVNFINLYSRKYNLNVNALQYNAAEELPSKLKRRFDVFIADPVEALKGLTITLSRGAEALTNNSVVYFGLTFLECPLSHWYKIEKLLLKMGFVITDIVRNYSYYYFDNYSRENVLKKLNSKLESKDVNWYRSNFIRCEAIKKPIPEVTGSFKLVKEFYYDNYQTTYKGKL